MSVICCVILPVLYTLISCTSFPTVWAVLKCSHWIWNIIQELLMVVNGVLWVGVCKLSRNSGTSTSWSPKASPGLCRDCSTKEDNTFEYGSRDTGNCYKSDRCLFFRLQSKWINMHESLPLASSCSKLGVSLRPLLVVNGPTAVFCHITVL
jgi:hypothetical protein